MKNVFAVCIFIFTSVFYARGQTGIDSIIVEKYYVSSVSDTVGQQLYGVLPVGSVTYRIYVDMKPGYKFQALYGVTGHELRIATSTFFFNNTDRGAKVPDAISVSNTRKNTVMLDSWFSVGATAVGKCGVLKTEDSDGSIGNTSGLLQNADPTAGIPIMTQDGMITGTPEPVTFVGFTTELDVFNNVSQLGNLFTTTNGSVACLNGAVGPTANNRVLIGQFTTNGKFSFKLNIQIGTPSGGVENYVAVNPVGSEVSIPGLIYPPPVSPTVTITSPTSGSSFTTGTVVPVIATAADLDGTVDTVRFFVDGLLHSSYLSPPYQANWTAIVGSHTLTAVGIDNDGRTDTSAAVVVNITNNVFPSCSITSPAAASTYTVGNTVTVTVNAADPDGVVDSVEFFVDGIKIGVDLSAPYKVNWLSTAGTRTLTAVATDNYGGKGTSAPIVITVIPLNVPPVCTITSPISTSIFATGEVVPIKVNASDPDGTIRKVDFFINNAYAGTDSIASYQFDWNAVVGTKTLKAVATDNSGAQTTSSTTTITVLNNSTPTVSVVFPQSGTNFIAGDVVTIVANAGDADGYIAYVQFYVKGIWIGNDADSLPPYQINWTSYASSSTQITAIAVDNKGAQKASSQISIMVKNNLSPTVNITHPINGSIKIGPGPLTIQANATDADGYVDSVEFYVDGYKVGSSYNPPFQCTYFMKAAGKDTLTAVAIDNHGMLKTSTNVIITVKDSTASGLEDLDVSSNLFNLYPNPAQNYVMMDIFFDVNKVNGNGHNYYVLYNMDGQKVREKELGNIYGKQTEKIDLSGFVSGQYMVELSIGNIRSYRRVVLR